MAWLESHGNLARHPKTRRLMQRMGWTLPFTIGNLHLLWWWALEYAPTGNLTRFEPEQITYDLDLGGSTPEQFIEAMIYAGFIDRSEGAASESPAVAGRESVLLLHDWPDYTSRYLRSSKFRRKPEKWLQVVDLYSLPAPKPRIARARQTPDLVVPPRRDPAVPRNSPSAVAEYEPQGAARIDCVEQRCSRQGGSEVSGDERNQSECEAVPDIVQTDPATEADSTAQDASANTVAAASSAPSPGLAGQELPPAGAGESRNPPVPPRREGQNPTPSVPPSQEPEAIQIAIPHILAMEPGFAHTWWPKFLAVYKNTGYPLNAYEAAQALAKLAEHPSKAVNILKHSVKTLTAHPERTRPGWNKNPTAPSGLTNNTT